MDLFKKLAVARRNNRSGSVVSDDEIENDFCYHDSDAVDSETSGDVSDGGSSSLYGRRQNSASPAKIAVVTSSKFDSDEVFSIFARAMINRYQNENMSEREAILGTFKNVNELRAFIEALDLKYIVLTSQITDGAQNSGDETLTEIVFKTRSLFDATLKGIWRENESSTLNLGTTGQEEEEGSRQHRGEMISNEDEYRQRHPKTPKNLRMSPMRTSAFNYKNHGFISQSESIDSACSEGSNSSMFRPFKRPRRWFFPHNTKTERLVTPPFSLSASKVSPEKITKKIPMKAPLPKFHFDFGKNDCASKKNSIILNRGPKVVQSLQLDGTLEIGNGSASTYVPPTSPMRKVSTEMKNDSCTATEIS